MWLKEKYRVGIVYKNRGPVYRTRTGPNCCGPGCRSNYKKGAKQVKERHG